MIIKFETEIWCGDDEPSRYVLHYQGTILGFDDDENDDDAGSGEPSVKIGEIDVFHVDRVRIINERESFYASMDESSDTRECYEALIDQKSGDWKDEVKDLIGEDALINENLLLIKRLELEERFRAKGIGSKVARQVVDSFGSTCAVIVCKPFPLQYNGYRFPENEDERKVPGYEQKRRAAFSKVASFWKSAGFRKLPSSEIYVLAEPIH